MMPFMFISPAFAPLDTMPAWMRAMAQLNPVSHATDALRGHVLGTATFSDTTIALATATALGLIATLRLRTPRTLIGLDRADAGIPPTLDQNH